MSKSYVCMTYTQCPVCGKKEHGDILLDNRLKESLPSEGICMGLVPCEDHYPAEGTVLLMEASRNGKSVSFLGRLCTIKEHAYKQIFDQDPNSKRLAFVESEVMDRLHEMQTSLEAET